MQAEQEPQLGRVANKKTAARVTNQAARQTPEDEGGQVRSLRDRRTNGRKPGRRPRRNRSFVICAGTQWRRASSDNRTRVTHDQLRNIAVALDAAGYTPPGKYLEGRSAKELKEFNSRNSNSKAGPIKTWVQLISINDKDHVRGMRRLLYRCAKVDGRPMSGN